MQRVFEPSFLGVPLPTPTRILSMDGGGIYGYSTALLLRKLCEQNKRFLDASSQKGKVWLFAGTSAGAINALLLAREANPRDAIMEGKLERFWKRPEVFAGPENPWSAYWSWFGVTAWLGQKPLGDLLLEIFGDIRLGELPHRVTLTTFNWSGTRRSSSHWGPKFFNNYPADNPDLSLPVRDVAYAVGAPPGLRPVLGGFGDGGVADPDPSRAALIEVAKKVKRDPSGQPGDPLNNVHLLSLGVCTETWVYGLNNFDLGYPLFSLLPTNPIQGNWWPPWWQISVDAPTETANHTCGVLLEERFHRLDPPLLGPPEDPPMLAATSLSRFPVWHDYLIDRQALYVDTRPEAQAAIRRAVDYLRGGWMDEQPSVSPGENVERPAAG